MSLDNNNMKNELLITILKYTLKSLYKFNENTDDFSKYIETVNDDVYFLLKQ
jgi:hypothetical protein